MEFDSIPVVPSLNPLVDADSITYASAATIKPGEPVAFALANAKSTLNNILKVFPDRKFHRIYLTGSGNFRDTLGTIKIYKANRKDMVKPEHLEATRDYLMKHWDAVMINGREADDAVGCAQVDKSSCIVGIDKDLNQIPGYHYNYRKQHFYNVTKLQANTFFWYQMLTGDRVDNIPGIKGVGVVTAQKIIEECQGDLTRLQERVEALYRKQYGEEAWLSAMSEVGSLLYIQRSAGSSWEQVLK